MQWFGPHIAAWLMVPMLALSAFFGAHTSFFAAPEASLPLASSSALAACTMEAKRCPDGSYVGRTGPACSFAACPVSTSSAPMIPAPIKPAPAPAPAPQPTSVLMYSITPTEGPAGTSVVIDGFGFTADNTILMDGSVAASDVPVSSQIAIACTTNPSCKGGIHQRLEFSVPTSLSPYCPPGEMIACPMYVRLVTPGSYTVQVRNANGTSDSVTFTVTSASSGSGTNLSISGLDAPTTLALGQSGTWTVHVSSLSTNPNLHYSVVWGDEAQADAASIMAPQPSDVQTSATFTHAYERSGSYTPTFTVTDDSGHSQSVSASVIVTPLY